MTIKTFIIYGWVYEGIKHSLKWQPIQEIYENDFEASKEKHIKEGKTKVSNSGITIHNIDMQWTFMESFEKIGNLAPIRVNWLHGLLKRVLYHNR